MKMMILIASLVMIISGCASKKEIARINYEIELIKIRVGYHHPYQIGIPDSNHEQGQTGSLGIECDIKSSFVYPVLIPGIPDSLITDEYPSPEFKKMKYEMPPEMYIIKP